MKISLDQLKKIIKEEVGNLGGSNVTGIMTRLDGEINTFARALAVEIANSGDSLGSEPHEVDAYIPEVENALRDAIENVVKEFV